MSAAAGAHIGTRNFHNTHRAFQLFFAAVCQRRQLFRRGHRHQHRHIFAHDGIGLFLGAGQLDRRKLHAHIHAHLIGANVKAHIVGPKQRMQKARKNMLAAVLLHGIPAALPVDLARYAFAHGQGGIQRVQHTALALLHIQHLGLGAVLGLQRAQITRLAAALGEKRGAAQLGPPAAFVRLAGHHLRRKAAAERVLLKQAFGLRHRGCFLSARK